MNDDRYLGVLLEIRDALIGLRIELQAANVLGNYTREELKNIRDAIKTVADEIAHVELVRE
jgi:hypothetical protein